MSESPKNHLLLLHMGLKDLFITPFYILVFTLVAYFIRPYLTTPENRKYFLPALWIRFVGAIALGLIYQFYYGGGDTFNYYRDGSIIYGAFWESFFDGIKILVADGTPNGEIFKYTSQLYWYSAISEFTISRFSAFFGLFTFNTYSATALFFAAFSFSGLWAFYSVLTKLYKGLDKEFAIAIFFFPSVFFWGSGLMKDTINLACLGWLFYSFYYLFIAKRRIFISLLIFLAALFILKTIRIYVLLAFIPPATLWIYGENIKKISSQAVRIAAIPFLLVPTLLIGYYVATTVTEGDPRYDLNNIGRYTKINAEYLHYVSVRQGGSAYYLGELDGTITGTLKLAPQAIWVAFFGPMLWQANNPVMLLSAIENTALLIFLLFLVFKFNPLRLWKELMVNPYIQFALIFAIIFAFAVGITSFNYGTLVRYKIPIIPFFLTSMFILRDRMRRVKS